MLSSKDTHHKQGVISNIWAEKHACYKLQECFAYGHCKAQTQ